MAKLRFDFEVIVNGSAEITIPDQVLADLGMVDGEDPRDFITEQIEEMRELLMPVIKDEFGIGVDPADDSLQITSADWTREPVGLPAGDDDEGDDE